MKTMAFRFRRADRLFIVAYGTTDPTDEDFSKFLEAVNRNRFGILGTRILLLVATEGGKPSEEQRKRFDAVIGVSHLVAVLSVSQRYRALVNMERWFRKPIKAFRMSEVDAALDFLKIPTQQYGQIKAELQEVFRELGAP